MGLREWLLRIAGAVPRDAPRVTPPRAIRRAAGRQRHHETGEPAWTSRDRDHRPRVRQVNDIGGVGMGYAGRRAVIDEDDDRDDRR